MLTYENTWTFKVINKLVIQTYTMKNQVVLDKHPTG